MRPGTASEWITLQSYINKVFTHLLVQWMIIWMLYQCHVGGLSWLNLASNWCKTYHCNYDIDEARNHFRLDYTSILYIYKVLKHHPMQWMIIWMHPYCIKTFGGGLSWMNLSNN